MISVKARLVRAAWVFVSTEETRYYINGVCIEPHHDGGAIIAGTDGRRLFCAYDKEGRCEKPVIAKLSDVIQRSCIGYREIVDVDEWDEESGRKTIDDGIDRALEIDADGRAQIPGVVRDLTDCRIDGKFPDWRKALPTTFEQTADAAFDAELLASFGKAARLLGDHGHQRIKLIASGNKSPALILFPKTPAAFGVLMPTVCEDDRRTVPPFAQKLAPAQQETATAS